MTNLINFNLNNNVQLNTVSAERQDSLLVSSMHISYRPNVEEYGFMQISGLDLPQYITSFFTRRVHMFINNIIPGGRVT